MFIRMNSVQGKTNLDVVIVRRRDNVVKWIV